MPPQRRVAPRGFGGSAGLAILSGVARGQNQRREEKREAQRQAVLQRMREAQTDRALQQMRHSKENQEFQQEQRERELASAEAVVEGAKPWLTETYGIEPSVAEDLTVDAVRTLQDIRQSEASMASSRASAARARASTERTNQQIQTHEDQQRAQELMSDPNFLHIATFDGIEESTRRKAIEAQLQSQGMEATPQQIEAAIRAAQNMDRHAREFEAGLQKTQAQAEDERAQTAERQSEMGGGSVGADAAAAFGVTSSDAAPDTTQVDREDAGTFGDQPSPEELAQMQVSKHGSPIAALRATTAALDRMPEDHELREATEQAVEIIRGQAIGGG